MAQLVDMILGAASEEDVQASYDDLFLNPEAVGVLLQRPKEDIHALVVKGASVKTTAFTTTFIARRLQKLSGTVFVAATFADYNKPFLYSIALAAEVDPGNDQYVVQLSERQAEVAFALAKCWSSSSSSPSAAGREGAGLEISGQTAAMEAEDDDDKEVAPLDWEHQDEDLEEDLLQVLSRHQAGSLQLSAKDLLDSLPAFEGLKKRAEANNHRQDAGSKLDRVLKQAQQRALGLQRVYACMHGNVNPEARALGQQFFTLLLQLEDWLLQQRKENSIPGSIAKTEEQLLLGGGPQAAKRAAKK